MPRYLVVANLTLGGEHLLEVLRERAEDPEARFHVLAPTSAAPDGFHMHDEEEATIDAHRRLKESMRRFGELGVKEVTGELGSSRPNDAIGDVIRANSHDTFDEIILSTLPAGPSKVVWNCWKIAVVKVSKRSITNAPYSASR